MTETDVINQLQALHGLVQDNHSRVMWNVKPDAAHPEDADWAAIAKLQIHLKDVFPATKKGRVRRLETLAAILPLLNPGKRPLEFTSTKVLWLGEVYALLSWLEQNGAATRALRAVAKDPHDWSVRIRRLLPYIERPVVEVPYAETEQQKDLGPLWSQEPQPHAREREEAHPLSL